MQLQKKKFFKSPGFENLIQLVLSSIGTTVI